MSLKVYVGDQASRFPHWIHMLFTLCSCGFWFPVWVAFYLQHKLSGGRG